MAEIDGLDIAPGRNQGEAVILPETTFDPVEFSRQALALQGAKQVAKKKKEAENRKKWDEIKDPIAKWDIDHQKLFLPQIEKNRADIRELMAKTNGRPTDAEFAIIQQKNNDLAQSVMLSDEQKKTFDSLMTKVQTAKGTGTEAGQSAYDYESEERVRAWGNPWDNEQVKLQNGKTIGEELKRLGATQFRAQYQGELTRLEPKWDLADKTLGWSKKLEDNKPRYGNLGSIKGIWRGHTDEQIESTRLALKQESSEKFGNAKRFEQELDSFMQNSMSEKDRNNLANNALKEAGIITGKGLVNPTFKSDVRKRVNEQMPDATEAEKQVASDMMEKEIIDNAIEKKMYNAYFRQKVEDKFTPYEKQEDKPSKKDSDEFDPKKDINWTKGEYKVNAGDYLATKYPEKAAYYQSQDFKNKPKNQDAIKNINDKLGRDYVAFNFKNGKENPSLVFNGAEVKPAGIFKGLDGKPYLVGSSQVGDTSNIMMFLASMQGENISEAKKEELKKKFGVQLISLSDKGNNTEVANKLGFKDVSDFNSFINDKLDIKDYSQYKVNQ